MAFNPRPPALRQVAAPPPPGAAVNTDSTPVPVVGAPVQPAAPVVAPAANERPDDLLTLVWANPADKSEGQQTQQVTRAQWNALPAADRAKWQVANAQSAASLGTVGVGVAAPVAPPAPPAPAPSGLSAGLGPAYMQTIKEHQAALGRPMTLNDWYALADPANGLGLGAVKEVRAPAEGEMPQFGGSPPQAIVEYTSGYKFGISAPLGALTDGGQGVTGDQITGFSYTAPTEHKSALQTQAEIDLARAQTQVAKASAAKQEALNTGIGTRDVDAQITSAQASAKEADARRRKIEEGLAAGQTDAEISQTLAQTAATTTTAQATAQNAATNAGQLVLQATLGEIQRRHNEGEIDNETMRILSEHAWRRWQADNTNTQTVLAAAGKGLEADLTERNQNIALDNTRLNAANSGFSDDVRTASSMNEWMNPGSDSGYFLLKGLQGMRLSQIKGWGGLQDHPAVQRPPVIQQLGYDTPVNLRPLEPIEDITFQTDAQRARRDSLGTTTQPVQVPTVKPVVTAPAAPTRTAPAPAPAPQPISPSPSPVFVPAPPVSDQARDDSRQPTVPAPVPAPASQSLIQSNNMITASLNPIRYAQGGTPIAVTDLFGRTRPTTDRHAWLR